MVKFAVDYYNTEQVVGGVQSFMQDLCGIYPDFRYISYMDAMYPVVSNVARPSQFSQFECEMSGIIHEYIEKYEKLFNLDVIVKNSIVGTFERHKTPMICIIQDNNILGPRKLYQHGFYNYFSMNLYEHIFPFLQGSTIRNSDVVVSTSNHVKECYDKKYGIDSKIIPNGIDTNTFKHLPNKDRLREKYGIPKNMKVGISVTSFSQIKGWHIMQRLINEFQDVFWIIVFKHSSSRPKLKNVRIFNQVQRNQLPELYNCSDFFILPSAMETCNLSGLEALGCGTPVVVSNCGFFWDGNLEKGFDFMDAGIRVEDWNYKTYKDALNTFLSGGHKFNVGDFITKNHLDMESWKKSWKRIIEKVI